MNGNISFEMRSLKIELRLSEQVKTDFILTVPFRIISAVQVR